MVSNVLAQRNNSILRKIKVENYLNVAKRRTNNNLDTGLETL